MAANSEDTSQEDRTESATSFRKEEFRKQGIVAQSRELTSVVLFLASGMAFVFLSQGLLIQFGELSRWAFQFGPLPTLNPQVAQEWLVRTLLFWVKMVAPLFAVVMVSGIIVGIAQVGFHVTTEPLSPNWDRINPIKGLKRIVSIDSVAEAFKAIVKMVVVFGVAWGFFKGRASSVGHYFGKSVPEITSLFASDLAQLFFSLVASLAVFAAFDYFYQRYRIDKQMRMTKNEVKEEYKLREGDPVLKQRIRSAQRRIARRRMMEAVPKADVIVTNPTHYSVALKYDSTKMRAPRVVAKGVDELALKIREVAKASGVPIVENRPLARSLYAQIEVGKAITEDMYTAVAQVLSYVYRLRSMNS